MSEPSFLRFPADLVPAEELSGNLDPLGTLTHAERLAETLLPCFTVRTWRGEAVSELMPWLSANAGKSKQMVSVPILQEKDRYDIVETNPPFGGKERQEVQQNFPIRAGEAAYLFLQHYIKILKAGGRSGIVIKSTFLSNTVNASVSLRQHWRESPPPIPVQALLGLVRVTPAGRGCRHGMSHDMTTTSSTTGKCGDLQGFTGNALPMQRWEG